MPRGISSVFKLQTNILNTYTTLKQVLLIVDKKTN
jgi:hypothetical protein